MITVGWTPLKEQSSRLPGKNWRPLGGKPLFAHMVQTMLDCAAFDRVIVNVDSAAIEQRVQAEFGAAVTLVRRPSHLESPTTSTVELLLHDMAQFDGDLWTMTHCTVPLLKAKTLGDALGWFVAQGRYRYDSVVSVTAVRERFYDALGRAVNHNVHVQLPLQDLPPIYQENNAFFVITREAANQWHNRVGMRPYLWEIDPAEAADIDFELDFRWAELLYANTSAAA